MLSRWLICVFFLPLVIGTVETAGAQASGDEPTIEEVDRELNRAGGPRKPTSAQLQAQVDQLDRELAAMQKLMPIRINPDTEIIAAKRDYLMMKYDARVTLGNNRLDQKVRDAIKAHYVKMSCNDGATYALIMLYGMAITWSAHDEHGIPAYHVYVDKNDCQKLRKK